MTLSVIGLLVLALICASTFGGIALRLAGILIALAGLLGLSVSGDGIGLVIFGLGAIAWFAGHLHFRLRHGFFKSAIAEWVCVGAASACRREPE